MDGWKNSRVKFSTTGHIKGMVLVVLKCMCMLRISHFLSSRKFNFMIPPNQPSNWVAAKNMPNFLSDIYCES